MYISKEGCLLKLQYDLVSSVVLPVVLQLTKLQCGYLGYIALVAVVQVILWLSQLYCHFPSYILVVPVILWLSRLHWLIFLLMNLTLSLFVPVFSSVMLRLHSLSCFFSNFTALIFPPPIYSCHLAQL